MIDTLHIFMEREQITEKMLNQLDNLERNKVIQDVSMQTFSNSGIIRKQGMLKGIKLSWGENSIKLKGSLSRYYLGNNLDYLEIDSTKDAIDQLCEDLKINIGDFKVTRVDMAATINMQYPVLNYLEHLESLSNHKKIQYGNETIYFKNTLRTFQFYNKLLQMKKKPGRKKTFNILREAQLSIEDHYLRVELQLTKKIEDQLKMDQKLKVRDLYNPTIYAKLVNCWYKYFTKVKTKRKILDLKQNENITSSVFIKYLAAYGYSKLCNDKVRRLVERKYKDKEYNTYYNIQKDINKLENRFGFESKYIRELNEEIKGIADYQLGNF